MASLSTGGEQAFEGADGSGTGCSLSAAQKARPVAERPILETERRVFCLRCAWSIEGWNRYAGGVREHLDRHPGAGLSLGVDYALGHRYGPLDGRRRRGRVRRMPALERRAGPRRSAEQKAAAIAASIATRRRQARERAAARRCSDCGAPGERKGHQECPYPQD
jgi:hypothetical protein